MFVVWVGQFASSYLGAWHESVAEVEFVVDQLLVDAGSGGWRMDCR